MGGFYSVAGYPFDLQIAASSDFLLVSNVQQALARVLHFFCLPDTPQALVPYHEPFSYHTPAGTLRSTALKTHYRFDLHLAADSLAADVIDLIDLFEPEIINQAVREAPGNLLWIHGACLVRDDETVLLVARTGTGKTTLSLGLLAQGYRLLTDDVILIDLETNRLLPMPRCPKYRDPAPMLLASAGFALPETLGHYVLLPSAYVQTVSVPAAIDRIYIMQRDPNLPPVAQDLSLTDGILGLLPYANLLAVDPDLSIAHHRFGRTRFSALNLGDYPRDLLHIASG